MNPTKECYDYVSHMAKKVWPNFDFGGQQPEPSTAASTEACNSVPQTSQTPQIPQSSQVPQTSQAPPAISGPGQPANDDASQAPSLILDSLTHLSEAVRNDLACLLNVPRIKALNWLTTWPKLKVECELLLSSQVKLNIVERSTAQANKKLQYINLNYDDFKDFKPHEYPGIEKGYEMYAKRSSSSESLYGDTAGDETDSAPESKVYRNREHRRLQRKRLKHRMIIKKGIEDTSAPVMRKVLPEIKGRVRKKRKEKEKVDVKEEKPDVAELRNFISDMFSNNSTEQNGTLPSVPVDIGNAITSTDANLINVSNPGIDKSATEEGLPATLNGINPVVSVNTLPIPPRKRGPKPGKRKPATEISVNPDGTPLEIQPKKRGRKPKLKIIIVNDCNTLEGASIPFGGTLVTTLPILNDMNSAQLVPITVTIQEGGTLKIPQRRGPKPKNIPTSDIPNTLESAPMQIDGAFPLTLQEAIDANPDTVGQIPTSIQEINTPAIARKRGPKPKKNIDNISTTQVPGAPEEVDVSSSLPLEEELPSSSNISLTENNNGEQITDTRPKPKRIRKKPVPKPKSTAPSPLVQGMPEELANAYFALLEGGLPNSNETNINVMSAHQANGPQQANVSEGTGVIQQAAPAKIRKKRPPRPKKIPLLLDGSQLGISTTSLETNSDAPPAKIRKKPGRKPKMTSLTNLTTLMPGNSEAIATSLPTQVDMTNSTYNMDYANLYHINGPSSSCQGGQDMMNEYNQGFSQPSQGNYASYAMEHQQNASQVLSFAEPCSQIDGSGHIDPNNYQMESLNQIGPNMESNYQMENANQISPVVEANNQMEGSIQLAPSVESDYPTETHILSPVVSYPQNEVSEQKVTSPPAEIPAEPSQKPKRKRPAKKDAGVSQKQPAKKDETSDIDSTNYSEAEMSAAILKSIFEGSFDGLEAGTEGTQNIDVDSTSNAFTQQQLVESNLLNQASLGNCSVEELPKKQRAPRKPRVRKPRVRKPKAQQTNENVNTPCVPNALATAGLVQSQSDELTELTPGSDGNTQTSEAIAKTPKRPRSRKAPVAKGEPKPKVSRPRKKPNAVVVQLPSNIGTDLSMSPPITMPDQLLAFPGANIYGETFMLGDTVNPAALQDIIGVPYQIPTSEAVTSSTPAEESVKKRPKKPRKSRAKKVEENSERLTEISDSKTAVVEITSNSQEITSNVPAIPNKLELDPILQASYHIHELTELNLNVSSQQPFLPQPELQPEFQPNEINIPNGVSNILASPPLVAEAPKNTRAKRPPKEGLKEPRKRPAKKTKTSETSSGPESNDEKQFLQENSGSTTILAACQQECTVLSNIPISSSETLPKAKPKRQRAPRKAVKKSPTKQTEDIIATEANETVNSILAYQSTPIITPIGVSSELHLTVNETDMLDFESDHLIQATKLTKPMRNSQTTDDEDVLNQDPSESQIEICSTLNIPASNQPETTATITPSSNHIQAPPTPIDSIANILSFSSQFPLDTKKPTQDDSSTFKAPPHEEQNRDLTLPSLIPCNSNYVALGKPITELYKDPLTTPFPTNGTNPVPMEATLQVKPKNPLMAFRRPPKKQPDSSAVTNKPIYSGNSFSADYMKCDYMLPVIKLSTNLSLNGSSQVIQPLFANPMLAPVIGGPVAEIKHQTAGVTGHLQEFITGNPTAQINELNPDFIQDNQPDRVPKPSEPLIKSMVPVLEKMKSLDFTSTSAPCEVNVEVNDHSYQRTNCNNTEDIEILTKHCTVLVERLESTVLSSLYDITHNVQSDDVEESSDSDSELALAVVMQKNKIKLLSSKLSTDENTDENNTNKSTLDEEEEDDEEDRQSNNQLLFTCVNKQRGGNHKHDDDDDCNHGGEESCNDADDGVNMTGGRGYRQQQQERNRNGQGNQQGRQNNRNCRYYLNRNKSTDAIHKNVYGVRIDY